jgi:hypothetical protein
MVGAESYHHSPPPRLSPWFVVDVEVEVEEDTVSSDGGDAEKVALAPEEEDGREEEPRSNANGFLVCPSSCPPPSC